VSLSMILHKLERIDAKVDRIDSRQEAAISPSAVQPQQEPPTPRRVPVQPMTTISFSAHLMIDWPAVRGLLPSSTAVPDGNYLLRAEEERAPLPMTSPRSYTEDFLAELSASKVRELSDAYFATFNLMTPVLDRGIFYRETIGSVINGQFDCDPTTCIVLLTMTLGCWGTQAMAEAEQQHTESAHRPDTALGLAFYNEARKRFGFLECNHSMEMCQVYLLTAIYYGQLLRPVDCWSMLAKASTCCLRFWSSPRDEDEWTFDMWSRLFWITVMIETVLTQELTGLPMSRIRDMEDDVPLPKFVHPFSQRLSDEESFYHYHFLSQIAHRMFLTRVYSSSYYSCRYIKLPVVLS
jgi:hypothetical protein